MGGNRVEYHILLTTAASDGFLAGATAYLTRQTTTKCRTDIMTGTIAKDSVGIRGGTRTDSTVVSTGAVKGAEWGLLSRRTEY